MYSCVKGRVKKLYFQYKNLTSQVIDFYSNSDIIRLKSENYNKLQNTFRVLYTGCISRGAY